MGLFERWKSQPTKEVHQDVLEAISKELNDARNEQAELTTSLKEAKEQLEKPFEQEEALAALLKKQSEINLVLEMGEQPKPNKKQQQNKVEASEVDFPDLDTPSAPQSVSHEHML